MLAKADHNCNNQLGAGTALPSCLLLHVFLTHQTQPQRGIHLCFADYNLSVLELATVPNLLLTWYSARSLSPLPIEGDLDITPQLLAEFVSDLMTNDIHLSGISGSWDAKFRDLVEPSDKPRREVAVTTTVLASETIYSPSSTKAFAEVLIAILEDARSADGDAEALIAAKKIYFGVGGSVDNFCAIVNDLGGHSVIVWESEGFGVGRMILRVSLA